MKSVLYEQLVNDLRNIAATRDLEVGDVTNISDAAWLIESMQSRIAELEKFKTAYEEWHDKTEWVQETATAKELGMHRADVMQKRIAELEKDAARWKVVLHHVGADNHLGGAHYVIRGIKPPANVMRGAVSQHFEKSIDTAMKKD